MPGRNGSPAPMTDNPGAFRWLIYRRLGAPWERCGSLARIGLPVVVRSPPITQLFDPSPLSVSLSFLTISYSADTGSGLLDVAADVFSSFSWRCPSAGLAWLAPGGSLVSFGVAVARS